MVTVDVLAIGAHPDDVELGVGGLILKLVGAGYRVGILDLTLGEMGSRGTAKERAREATQAGRLLGVTTRQNAKLPDGGVQNSHDNRLAVLRQIRKLQPSMILAPMAPDRHPDHSEGHALVRDANFYAGVSRVEPKVKRHRADRVYYYYSYSVHESVPACVVDISGQFEAKLDVLRAYGSQFYNPDYKGPDTYISSPGFWEAIRTRAAYWGQRIGAGYGEPLYCDGAVGVVLPPGLEHIHPSA